MNLTMQSETRPNTRGRLLQRRWVRWLLVTLGIIAGQAVLYGPSLVGRKILLPLDCLAQPAVYLPATPAYAGIVPHDITLSDLVLQFETERRFVAAEYRAGRFPLWLPYQYAGVPLVWPRYSPFILLACATESPRILAWSQMLAAWVAGLGMYAFCRRALRLGFWPAAVAAWCYPLAGFFVLWQGFPTCGAVYWLAWLLLAVHRSVRAPAWTSIAGLAVATALTLISGHIDVAGQALIAAGLYGVWRIVETARRAWHRKTWRVATGALALGWTLGFALALPHVWPLLEYAQTGARMERRGAGVEERPPGGLKVLPEVVLPDYHGTTRAGSVWLRDGNQQEGPAAGYAGVGAMLLLAPLAWFSRRHRSFVLCWLLLGALGLSWCLNVPGIVALLRLPGLKMMSHNRLVLMTAFAVVVLAAIGLQQILRRQVRWQRWCWIPLLMTGGIAACSFYRAAALPEPLATQAAAMVAQGRSLGWVRSEADVAAVQSWFRQYFGMAATFSAAGVLGWIAVRRGVAGGGFFAVAAAVAVLDLLNFGRGRSAQCDPALYFPRIPLLEEIARSQPGRVIGYGCLPATLAQTHVLRDVRGYDSFDPARLVELLANVADPRGISPPYALTQWFVPTIRIVNRSELQLAPILNMLGVTHLIFRGQPPREIAPHFTGVDYWALASATALPRVFVPRRIELVADKRERLRRLAAAEFDPRALALVEEPLPLEGPATGEGRVVEESANRVVVSANMATSGLLVLGDAWNPGWRARVNGAPAPVVCVNHYLRGVVVPAGASTVEFSYLPQSVVGGFAIAAATALGLTAAVVRDARRRRRASTRFRTAPSPAA